MEIDARNQWELAKRLAYQAAAEQRCGMFANAARLWDLARDALAIALM